MNDVLASRHFSIFESIKGSLYSKALNMKIPNPSVEVDDFKSRAYEILKKLDSRLGSLIITKDLTESGTDELYSPCLHSEELLLETVYKYLVKSFVHLQITKLEKQTKTVEIDNDAVELLISEGTEAAEDLIATNVLLDKIESDIDQENGNSVQMLTHKHFLSSLKCAISLLEKDFDIKYVARVSSKSLEFSRSFFFLLWRVLPRFLAERQEVAENPLVQKQLNKITNSEYALKQRVFRYFKDYKGGMYKRLV
jgi:hypothetical protein